MERTVKLGDMIEIKFDSSVLTPNGYINVAYAYVSKLDVKFGHNGFGFDAKYLNNMTTETCTLDYKPNRFWRVVS
jgi:hypothetical protein